MWACIYTHTHTPHTYALCYVMCVMCVKTYSNMSAHTQGFYLVIYIDLQSSQRGAGKLLNMVYTNSDLPTYVPTYIRTNIHTYLHKYVYNQRTYVPTYIRTYIHMYQRTYVHTHLRTYSQRTYVPTYLGTYILCTYVPTYIRTYVPTSHPTTHALPSIPTSSNPAFIPPHFVDCLTHPEAHKTYSGP